MAVLPLSGRDVQSIAARLLAGEPLFASLRPRYRNVRVKELVVPRDVVERAARDGSGEDAFVLRQVLLPLLFRATVHRDGILPCGGGVLRGDRLWIEEPSRVFLRRTRARARLSDLGRAAEIVGHAHRRGFVHADLKPDHIAATRDGVFVLDWDAAVAWRDSHSRGAFGFCGTPEYMAPEQATGRIDLVSPRTDVFGLGLILYEILHGAPARPRSSDFSAQLADARERRIVCSSRVWTASRHMAAVCERALSLDPAARYRDGSVFARVLKRAMTLDLEPAA